MGIDVVFKVRPRERMDRTIFDELRAKFYEAHPDPQAKELGYRYPSMEWDPYEDAPTIEVSSLDRYYGPGYERGHWPQIAPLGDWLAANIDGEVRYGGDDAGEWAALQDWTTARAECQALWDSVGNEPYRRSFHR